MQAVQRREIEQNQVIANQAQDALHKANKERINTDAAEKALESEMYVMVSFDNIADKERLMSIFGLTSTDKVVKGERLMEVLNDKYHIG